MNQAGKIARLELQVKDLKKEQRELTRTVRELATAVANLEGDHDRTRGALRHVLGDIDEAIKTCDVELERATRDG